MIVGGNYTIDFAKVSNIPKFAVGVKAGDSKRKISLTLLENNTAINLDNYTVVVACKKSDGNDILNDVNIVDAINGKCEVEITEQMLALDTDLPCEIVLYGGNGVVATSSNFVIGRIASVRSDENIVSSSEFTALTKAMTKIKNIDNKIWSMANMGQDVKEAMTGGSVAVVGENTILTENIVDNQVTYKKTNFLKREGKNLFDKLNIVEDKALSFDTGAIFSYNGQSVTEYIPLIEGETYVRSGLSYRGGCIYDISKQFIRAIPNTEKTFKVEQGEAFIVENLYNDTLDTFQLEIGENSTSFEPRYFTIDGLLINNDMLSDNSLNGNKFEDNSIHFNKLANLEYSKNLFNKNTSLKDSYINQETGNVFSLPGYYASDWIEVESNTQYSKSAGNQMAYYDEFKKYISGSDNETIFTTPQDCKYLRLTIPKGFNIDEYQLIKGTSIGEFTKYGAAIKELNITNENIDINSINGENITNGTLSVNKIKELIHSKNIFNYKTVIQNSYIDKKTGNVFSLPGYYASDWIEVEPNTDYSRTAGNQGSWYDKDKTFISGFDGLTTITSPNEAKYMRTTIPKGIDVRMYQVEKGSSQSHFEEYGFTINGLKNTGLLNNWEGKHLYSIGDSLTQAEKWQPTVVSLLNLGSNTTQAFRGGMLTANSEDDLNAICNFIENTPEDANLITVWSGTNDWSNSRPLGQFGDTTKLTFYGAVRNVIEWASINRPGAKLFFITPLQRDTDGFPNTNEQGLQLNNNNNTLIQYVNAIKETCEFMGIPVLDMYRNSGINKFNMDYYLADRLHPSNFGYNYVGFLIGKFINYN